MPNDYFDSSGVPANAGQGSSAAIRAEFDLIEAAFAKLPTLTAKANKAVVVNAGATGLTTTTGSLALAGDLTTVGASALTLTTGGATDVTLPTTGTLATLAGAEALTNKAIDTSTIGATTPGTGAFTTLSVTTAAAQAVQIATAKALGAPYLLARSGAIVTAPADTVENTLATIVVPGNAIGPNGSVRITSLMRFAGSGTKTLRHKFGGTDFCAHATTTSVSTHELTIIRNRNDAAAQVGMATLAAVFGTSTSAIITATVDTTADVTILITAQKATGADTAAIEGYDVEVVYGA